jgi:hypothetical protein
LFGIFFIICIILTKWLLAHFVELGSITISVQDECIIKKWRKERENLVMIKKPKVKISVLVMHRENQMGT